MLGLLKRHAVEVLLKAGHKRTDVGRLTGISSSSVLRIAGEASIVCMWAYRVAWLTRMFRAILSALSSWVIYTNS